MDMAIDLNKQIIPSHDSESYMTELGERTSVRLEGIFCKGYGHLPKMAMFDPDLSVEAKSIYALFCSYAGAGEDVNMPPVAVIRETLRIGKVAYSKHFNMLLRNGYILVEQTRGANASNTSYFTQNTYTIVKFPDKFKSFRPDGQYKKEYADIKARHNLIGAGYGLIPKLPLLSELPIAVKGLYAYLICFATHEEPVVWPSYEMIQRHLNLSENTVIKYLNLLVKTPFVRKLQQERNSGQFGAAKYEMQFALQAENATEPYLKNDATEPYPKNDATEPYPKNDATEPYPQNDTTEPYPKNDTTEPYPKKPSTEKPSTEKPSTENDTPIYNTTPYKTSSYNTSTCKTINLSGEPKISEPTLSAKKIDPMDRITRPVFEEEDWDQIISDYGNIPEDILYDEQRRNAAVKHICEWNVRSRPMYYILRDKDGHVVSTDEDLKRKIYITFVNALKDMLDPDNSSNHIPYYKVWENLPLVMNIHDSMDPEASLFDFTNTCTEMYYKAIRTKPVEYPMAYMKSLIWNAMLDGGISPESGFMHDIN